MTLDSNIKPTITISVEDYNILVKAAKQETYNVEKLVDWIYDYAHRDIDKSYILNALYSSNDKSLGHLVSVLQL